MTPAREFLEELAVLTDDLARFVDELLGAEILHPETAPELVEEGRELMARYNGLGQPKRAGFSGPLGDAHDVVRLLGSPDADSWRDAEGRDGFDHLVALLGHEVATKVWAAGCALFDLSMEEGS